MIIRFINKGKVFEISEDDSPILIYANKTEKKMIHNAKEGQCVILAKDNPEKVKDILMSTKEPKRMKN